MPGGPQPLDRASRMALAHEIADRILSLHQQSLLAIGLYGSLARGTDGPYSDLEMLCVLDSVGEDYTYEWVYGSWKAEVNFYSQEVLLAQATGVRGDWPLTHGSYQQILVLYDPGDFFVKLRDAMLALPPERFMETIREVIVGELYEWIGKLRNARYMGHTTYLPELALNMAKYGAFIIGLFNRHTYSTGPRLLEESLALPYRPAGYDALCHLAMRGDLSYPDRMAELCEAFWAGVEQWAIEQGIVIEESSKIPF